MKIIDHIRCWTWPRWVWVDVSDGYSILSGMKFRVCAYCRSQHR